MNKCILLAVILSFSAPSGLMLAGQLEKPCIDEHRHVLKTTVSNYILAYVALYSAIPGISAIAIALLGSAPLRNSFTAFKTLNGYMGKSLLKTIPITVPLVCAYNSVKKNMSE